MGNYNQTLYTIKSILREQFKTEDKLDLQLMIEYYFMF